MKFRENEITVRLKAVYIVVITDEKDGDEIFAVCSSSKKAHSIIVTLLEDLPEMQLLDVEVLKWEIDS